MRRDDVELRPGAAQAPHHPEPRDASAEHDAGSIDTPARRTHDLSVVDHLAPGRRAGRGRPESRRPDFRRPSGEIRLAPTDLATEKGGWYMAGASMATDAATETTLPESEEDAIAAFGDGADVVVVGRGNDRRTRHDVPASPAGESAHARPRRPRRDHEGAARRSRSARRRRFRTSSTARAARPVRRERRRPRNPLAGHRGRQSLRGRRLGGARGDCQGAFLALGATARSAGAGDVARSRSRTSSANTGSDSCSA